MFNLLLRRIRIIFLIVVSISFYGGATKYNLIDCPVPRRNTIICKSTNLISKPSYYAYWAYQQTKLLFLNKSTSGLIIQKQNMLNKKKDFEYKPGFEFKYPKGSRPKAGYLLLSAANPSNRGYPLIELWDMNKQIKLHTYKVDLKDIFNKLGWSSQKDSLNRTIRLWHPYLLDNGSIITNVVGYGQHKTILLDQCGKFIKANEDLFGHHSIEGGKDGYIYTSYYGDYEGRFFGGKLIDSKLHPLGFEAHGIAIIDQDLNTIKKLSLLDIYEKNGLIGDIYGNETTIKDPFHLNDVEPYIDEYGNKYVLLSMKGHSRIMALDLKTENVLWFIDRATGHQHDVDVIKVNNDGSIDISIFDNNAQMFNKLFSAGNRVAFFKGLPMNNNLKTFNIGDLEKYEKYKLKYESFESLDDKFKPTTNTEGRADILVENNSLMIEDTNFGRLFETDIKEGNMLWHYSNNIQGKTPYMMSWSRRINKLPNNLNTDIFDKCNI